MHRHKGMRLFLPILLLWTGCSSSPRVLPQKAMRRVARVVPMGTELEVELLSPTSSRSPIGERVRARLLHSLGDGTKGAGIPEGATLEGFCAQAAPTLPMHVQFESLTFLGTTMRLRAKAQPLGEAERRLKLTLEEPLPLSTERED